ncbi:hypothetical protein BGZ58_000745 [Dissophora ornata]|nr:hypothetical protein BGZ58_000745 [Dissophora ornata]
MSKGAETGGAVDAASGLNDGVTIEKPPKIKVSNKEAWHFILLWPHDRVEEEVAIAFAETQQNILQLLRVQEYEDAQVSSAEQALPTSSTLVADIGPDTASSDSDEDVGETPPIVAQTIVDVNSSLSTHKHLLVSVSKLLDGSPFISKLIDQHRDDEMFMGYFVPEKTGAEELAADDWFSSASEGNDTENQDYVLGPKLGLQATIERGSPFPVGGRTRVKLNSFIHQDRRALRIPMSTTTEEAIGSDGSGQDGGDTEEDEAQTKEDTFVRGQIHGLLTAVAGMMGGSKKLKRYLPQVELIADSMVNRAFKEDDRAYSDKCIEERNIQAKRFKERKAKLALEKEKLDRRFPL